MISLQKLIFKLLLISILSFLEGESDSSISQQVKSMEESDAQLDGKRQQFDSDFERLQRERGEIGNGLGRR